MYSTGDTERRVSMFSEMIADLNRSIMPNPAVLARRFDFALTKKMGVISLPRAFWMNDAKINPRSEHLLWAALLLLDRDRIESAVSVIALEISEKSSAGGTGEEVPVSRIAEEIAGRLLEQIPDSALRRQFAGRLQEVMPEWYVDGGGSRHE